MNAVKTCTTTTRSITLSEDDIQSVLIEYAKRQLGFEHNIEVEFEVSDFFLKGALITSVESVSS